MNTLRILTTAAGLWLSHRGRRAQAGGGRSRERGQVLAIFAVMSIVLLGGAALISDVAWWWTFEQRMQRAADAAALAGAVYLPGRQDLAYLNARAEAKKNGFDDALADVLVTTRRDPSNDRKLIVDIDAPVETNFARVFCWDGGPCLRKVDVGVTGAAEFMPRLPMGSPENYYGVFGTLRGATFTEMPVDPPPGNTDWRLATAAPTGGQWAFTSGNITTAVNSDNNVYAYETRNDDVQQWRDFGLVIPSPAVNQSLTIRGVEVRLQDAFVSDACPSSRIGVNLSWNGGSSWTNPATPVRTPDLGTDISGGDYTLGSNANTTVWGTHTWVSSEFSNTNFRVRLTAIKGCATAATQLNVDMLEVRVSYQIRWVNPVTTTTNDPLKGPGTPCANGAADCYNPDGSNLNARGFWATMNTRGASNVNGDAHQPYYDTAGGTVAPVCPVDSRACYDPAQYYNYAVEMPPNSTGGYVYVFDPGFCATANSKGTGDRWFGTNNAVSSWYELFADDRRTPYQLTDDRLVVSSGSLFTNLDATDSTMGASGGAECRKSATAYGDGRDYHLSWYLLNPDNPLTGGPRGTVYRVHTTGTDPAGSLLSNTDGEQSFALYATATGGSPRIYGLGSMQMFTPLSSSGGATSSEFYLAQIDAAYAGRTVEIQLWDPGDTAPLTAGLEILVPGNSGVWSAAPLTYWAIGGTSNRDVNTACNSNKRTNPSRFPISTESTGSAPGEFNGCWLTIRVQVPSDYSGAQDGWWKIRYNMTGTGTSNDVTTWKVGVIGNPVHLVPE